MMLSDILTGSLDDRRNLLFNLLFKLLGRWKIIFENLGKLVGGDSDWSVDVAERVFDGGFLFGFAKDQTNRRLIVRMT